MSRSWLRFCSPLAFIVMLGPTEATVIDSFNEPAGTAFLSVSGNSTHSTTESDTETGISTALTIGGVRGLSLSQTSSQGNKAFLFRLDSIEMLHWTNAAAATSDVVVTWDAGGVGLGGVDITESSDTPELIFTVDTNNSVGGFDYTVEIQDTGGLNIASWTDTITTTGGVIAPLTGFTNANLVDFTAVDSISLSLAGNIGGNVKLTAFQTIPEPASATFLLTGIGGLICLRRSRRR